MRPLGWFWLRIVRAISEALFHDGAEAVPSDRLDWLVGEWADFSAHAGMKTRIGFRGALLALELLPLFVVGVPLPMSVLPLKLRTRYLEKVETSNRAFLVTALKAPLSMIYFEHEDVVGRTEYDGTSLLGDDPERDLRPGVKAGRVRLPTLRAAS